MSLSVRVSVREVKEFADRLRTIDGRRLAASAIQAVNEVTVAFNESSIREQTRGINLSPAYVKSKTDVTLADSPTRPRAEIVTRGDLTVLGNFAPLSRIVAPGAPRKAGPVKGFRSAGVRVAIRRAEYLTERQWFILPLRRGTEAGRNGFGVFVRDPRLRPSSRAKREGKYGKRHIYGPSPYSLFRRQIDTRYPEIERGLAQRALQLMGDALEQELS
jgi:hypothetical protein